MVLLVASAGGGRSLGAVEALALATGSLRSTGLSRVPRRRTALDDDRVDLLLRPLVAGFGVVDFRGGIALIETGYQYAVEALAKSGLAERFMT